MTAITIATASVPKNKDQARTGFTYLEVSFFLLSLILSPPQYIFAENLNFEMGQDCSETAINAVKHIYNLTK